MIYLDIETYSPVDLKKCGVYAYSEHPDFQILMAAYSLDGKTVRLASGEQEIAQIPGLFDPDVPKVAHNAPFERVCLSRLAGDGFRPASEWIDTMAIAAVAGYPQSLSALAAELGAAPKDEAGTRLINTFCKPNRKGERFTEADKPEDWAKFRDYCIQDVYTLIDVAQRLPEMPESERRIWLADQKINDEGIPVDLEMAQLAVGADAANRKRDEAELRNCLGIQNAASVQQILTALEASGLPLPDLRADTVRERLRDTSLDPGHRRALELRQGLALVASAKYQAVLRSVSSDCRLRGQFRYFGAHTGRWSGRGVQFQNLPRAAVTHPESAILDLKLGLGADSADLKGLVRSLFLGPMSVVDYSAIEARVLAWVAGEAWVLEAFRDGRDIYVETANRMSTPDRPLKRQQGKVAVLALGYQGGIESLRGMGAEGTDVELQDLVQKYRRANPRIVRLWRSLEAAFRNGGQAGRLRVEVANQDRHLILPSGRRMIYRKVDRSGRTFQDPRGHRVDTYGGRLTENAVQAISRDLLADALVNLTEAGLPVIGHVHDEVLVKTTDVERVEQILTTAPDWAKSLPLAAEGFTCDRYRK